jgi:hypothetical protein
MGMARRRGGGRRGLDVLLCDEVTKVCLLFERGWMFKFVVYTPFLSTWLGSANHISSLSISQRGCERNAVFFLL